MLRTAEAPNDQAKKNVYVHTKKDCGLLLMLRQPDINKLAFLIPNYSVAYVFAGDSLFYVDKLWKTCTLIRSGHAEVANLIAALKLENLTPLADGQPKRCGKALSPAQLFLITQHTGHTISPITLDDVLHEMLNAPSTCEDWQEYLESRHSDASLYYFLLGLDVNTIIDATWNEPSKHDLAMELLEAARKALDNLTSSTLHMPAVESDRAYLFCLLEVYRRIRSQGPEYESWSSSFFPGLSKTERLEFCTLYKRFITSRYHLNQFDDFLKEEGCFDKKKRILQGTIKVIHDCTKRRGIDLEQEDKLEEMHLSQQFNASRQSL